MCVYTVACVFSLLLSSHFPLGTFKIIKIFFWACAEVFFGFSLFLCCSLFLVVNFYSVSGLFSSIFNWLFYLSRERNKFALIQQVGDVQRVGLSFFLRYGLWHGTKECILGAVERCCTKSVAIVSYREFKSVCLNYLKFQEKKSQAYNLLLFRW